jgi:hypothetical protein
MCVYKLPPTRYSDTVSHSKIEGLLSLSLGPNRRKKKAILLLKMLLLMEGLK